ncbi:hypothetical protein CLAVI_000916 [Candidatus Clavichlamydia salmonicola]|uniref:hypothetical protein n=1 Tax=Candidatus Clavichlamydia salmonicola TaxID=469812 RepID=UPI001890EE97|nr:hypothetical protein [Candidatus Clavichlamydia salmonicola]MBF5051275.1 hypothetical protein [Candidatus Clavichlamydia salmonicola]
MPYFNLKYLDTVSTRPASTFILIEETTSLTPEKILTISNLAYLAIRNRAICSSVPASFPLDTSSHQNTLLILEDLFLILVSQSSKTCTSLENHPSIQSTLSYLYSILWTNGWASFQQELPTSSLSEDPAFHNPKKLKRTLSFSNIAPVSKKHKDPDQPRSTKSHTTLKPLDTIHRPLTFIKKSNFYLLPHLEILPRKNRFIVTQQPVTNLENYFSIFHAELNSILRENICLLNNSISTKRVKVILCNKTFEALLPLLQQQKELIQLITDPGKHQACQDEHLHLIQEVIIRLQAAGFTDTSISNIISKESPLIQKNQPNPNSLPNSKSLKNLVKRKTINKTSLSQKSKPASSEKQYLVPLCLMSSVKKMSGNSSAPIQITFTCSYQVKTSTRSISQCYSRCRLTIFLFLQSVIELCQHPQNIILKTKYACPFNKQSHEIPKIDLMKRLFLGIQNNLAFFKQYHPELLESTLQFTPLDDLEKALALVKNELHGDLPLEESPNILSQILIKAQKNPSFKRSTSDKKPLALKTKIKHKKATHSLTRKTKYQKTITMMPVFSCSKKISSSTHTTPGCIMFTLYYQLRVNYRSLSHLLTHLRHTIKILLTSVQSLLMPSPTNEMKIIFRSIPPFQIQSQIITPEEALNQLFHGLHENLSFLADNCPKLFIPTQQNNPLEDLQTALNLVTKALKNNIPQKKPPFILSQILQENLISKPILQPEYNKKLN